MAANEVFADGIGSVRIVGDTVRIEFVSVNGQGRHEHSVRVVVPTRNLSGVIDVLRRAERSIPLRDVPRPDSGEVV